MINLGLRTDDLTLEMLPDTANYLPGTPQRIIPGTPQRIISNQRLLELGITLCYPSFREGIDG